MIAQVSEIIQGGSAWLLSRSPARDRRRRSSAWGHTTARVGAGRHDTAITSISTNTRPGSVATRLLVDSLIPDGYDARVLRVFTTLDRPVPGRDVDIHLHDTLRSRTSTGAIAPAPRSVAEGVRRIADGPRRGAPGVHRPRLSGRPRLRHARDARRWHLAGAEPHSRSALTRSASASLTAAAQASSTHPTTSGRTLSGDGFAASTTTSRPGLATR